MNTTQPNLKEFIGDILRTDTDDSTVTVLPIRCGLGKSTYVRNLIREICESKSSDGLIVVTDSIDRLNEYDHSSDEPTESLIREFPGKISVIIAENVSTEIVRQAYCKVLLLTTQRYFALTREEIKNLLRYNGGRRTTIIIDEKPLLKEAEKITFQNVTDVRAALFNIDDSVDREEKNWCVDQWIAFEDHIAEEMKTGENVSENQYFRFWFTDAWTSLTSANDDKRFFKFIEAHKGKISREAYKIIQLCQQLIEDGAVFDCHKIKSGKYQKQFCLCVDNRDKLINLGAKVIVLDGSGDISPEYRTTYINMIDCSQFNVSLSNLEIVCVNVNASKSKLKKDSSERESTIDAIKKYLEKHCPKVPVFTYLQNDKDFPEFVLKKNSADEESAEYVKRHFSAVKGLNNYRDCTELAQVGLNRFDEVTYFLLTELSEEKKHYLKLLKPEQGVAEFEKIFALYQKGSVSITETMLLSIFADVEQNLFRSAVRNVNFDGKVKYWMFFNTKLYAPLIELMRERYGKLGATILVREKPLELTARKIENRKAQKITSTQKFMLWYKDQQSGRKFKRADVLNETGLTASQFKDIKKRARTIFSTMETEEEGVYRVP